VSALGKAVLALGLVAAWTHPARAAVSRDRGAAAGYFRVMTRPDFQGGNSRLGFWNLYGRLLNEGPWAALELRLDLIPEGQSPSEVWTSVHAKVEGGSVFNADAGRGWLGEYFLTQLYVQAGNVLFEKITWQLGTLDTYFGDLGLYDLKPAQIFYDTVGLSARYRTGLVDLLVGVGDAGYFLKGTRPTDRFVAVSLHDPAYNTVLTSGGTARLHVSDHFEVGGGGQYYYEPRVEGNRYAAHTTPLPAGIGYEDYYRGRIAERFEDLYPLREFPRPEPVSASSWKVVGYLGFGNFGLLRWSSLYASYARLHPLTSTTELGHDEPIYIKQFTDERYAFVIGNEAQLVLVPDRLDAVWAVLFGTDENRDDDVVAGEDNRSYASTVLRLQYYATDTVHILVESSVAQELSKNGNLWREHYDSVFTSADGAANANGLEFGDTDRRFTWQGKGGLVLNPGGAGVFTRPSIRLLYGLQYSNVHDAFGNNFAQTLGDYAQFKETQDRHWHSVVALEAEAWF
jgi:hypothetical protein